MEFDLSDLDFEELGQKPMTSIGDFHLRSALYLPNPHDLLGKMIGRRNEKKAAKRILKFAREFPTEIISEPPAKFLGKMFLNMRERKKRPIQNQEIKTFREKIMKEAIGRVRMEVNGLPKIYREGDKIFNLLHEVSEQGVRNKWMIDWQLLFMCAVQYSNSLDHDRDVSGIMGQLHSYNEVPAIFLNEEQIILLFGELIMLCSGDFSICLSGEISGQILLSSLQFIDCLRMFADKVTERTNVLIANELGYIYESTEYIPEEVLINILRNFDQGLISEGNDFYKVIKVYESIMVGITLNLKVSGFVPPGNNFLENTVSDVEDCYKPYITNLIEIVNANSLNFQQISQLHGLFRIWGHPVIDPIAGVEKMKRIGTKEKEIDNNLAKMLDRKFKEKFFNSYYKKNRKMYPPHKICNDIPDSYILDRLRADLKIDQNNPNYHVQDWDAVICEKTFNLPETFNLSLLVADTAISPTREELKKAEKDTRGALKPEWRRGVLKWMRDGVIDCILLLTLINVCPTGLPLIYLIVGLYPKEREVNPIARMFSLMTLLMRAYFVITEDMLSKHILPHLPNISMTYDLLKLTKKITNVSRRQQNQIQGGRTFCINMDFEKWNLNFRKETTFHLFKTLGRLFGKQNLYNRTYDIFRSSLFYLSDGSYMPKFSSDFKWIPDSTGKAFERHLGGNEGLRQKGWTIATSMLLELLCDRHQIDYQLMGQGDNQVLLVTIYSKMSVKYGIESLEAKLEIQDKLTKFLDDLFLDSKRIGLPIKPLETWISDQFFAYGKLPVYKGVAGSQSLKKIARCFPFSNDDIMTLDNMLGAISASYNSACSADFSVFPSFFISQLQSFLAINWVLTNHPLSSVSINYLNPPKFQKDNKSLFSHLRTGPVTRDNLVLMINLIPKILGGYNTHNTLMSHCRGNPGPVSHLLICLFDLHEEGFREERNISQFQRLIENWIAPLFNTVPRYSMLVSDPYSINIWTPPSSKTITQKMIRSQVKSIAGNSQFALWFKELMGITEDKKKQDLINILSDTEIIFPRLCYSLIKGSIFGYAESVTSKIDKTVTLSRMTSSQQNVVGTIWEGEERFLRYFYWRSSLFLRPPMQINCSLEYAIFVRNIGWKKEVIGVSSPCAYEVIKESEDLLGNGIIVRTEVQSLLNKSILLLINGSSIPYLGSKVKEDIGYSITEVMYGTDPLLSRPIHLFNQIGNMTKPGSNWSKLIINNLASITDFDFKSFISQDSLIRSNAEQKYNDGSLDRGAMWNFLFSIGTHISVNTLNWSDSGERGELVLQYQSLICFTQNCFLRKLRGNIPEFQEEYVTDCTRCLKKTVDRDLDLKENAVKFSFPSFPNNPYLFIRKDLVKLKMNDKLKYLLSFPRISPSEMIKLSSELKERTISYFLARDIYRQLGKSNASEIDLQFAALDAESKIVSKIRPVMVFQYLKVLFWAFLYKKGDSEGRAIQWEIDRQLIIKKILRFPNQSFKGMLSMFHSIEVVNWLRDQRWFCPPLSYPIDINHGLISMKTSLINFIRVCDDRLLEIPHLIHEGEGFPYNRIKANRFVSLIEDTNRCEGCLYEVASLDISDIGSPEEFLTIICKEDHKVFPEHLIHSYSVLDSTMKQLSDNTNNFIYNRKVAVEKANMRVKMMNVNQEFFQCLSDVLIEGGLVFSLDSITKTPYMLEEAGFIFEIEKEWDIVPWVVQPISIPTRGYPRTIEIISVVLSHLRTITSVVVLGDGFGGSSLAVKHMLRSCQVSCWTIFDDKGSIPNTEHIAIPPSQYLTDENILNLSNVIYGDIFDPGFFDLWRENKVLEACDMIFSEVELDHYPKEQNFKMIINMLEILLSLGKKILVIKMKIENYIYLENVCELCAKRGYRFEIYSTPLVNIKYGEFWLYLENTYSPLEMNKMKKGWRNCIHQCVGDKLVQIGKQVHIRMYRDWWYEFLNKYQNAIEPHPCFVTSFHECNGWFYESGITQWMDNSYTKLFNEVRQFKAPEYVRDYGERKFQYMFFENEEQLSLRLLAIALANLKEEEEIERILSRKRKYILRWVVKKGRVNHLASPYLDLIPTGYSDSEINVICKYLPIIRYIYVKNKSSVYETLADRIMFKYIPSHIDDRKKFNFRISKTMSSYIY
uniref:RNA-directed RNA polymerase n=1 Tax=Aristolochia-associated cytorhabdovirus TaxID=3071548 RepID=A0AA50QPI3_9RHAB|nr:polymerase protein [Aristolochia-associated cytorhabdovirus]